VSHVVRDLAHTLERRTHLGAFGEHLRRRLALPGARVGEDSLVSLAFALELAADLPKLLESGVALAAEAIALAAQALDVRARRFKLAAEDFGWVGRGLHHRRAAGGLIWLNRRSRRLRGLIWLNRRGHRLRGH